MQTKNDQLVVRQHERLLCSLRAHLSVAEANASQVSIARTIGDGSGAIEVELVDCSRGGLGIQSSLFLPRSCQLVVRLIPDDSRGIPNDLELLVRVQRASMISRTPTYYLGVSFRVPGPPQIDRVERLLVIASQNAPRPGQTHLGIPERKVV